MKYTSQKQSKKEIKTYTKKYTEKIDTLSSIKLTSLSNSKIDHKDVFSNNNQIDDQQISNSLTIQSN